MSEMQSPDKAWMAAVIDEIYGTEGEPESDTDREWTARLITLAYAVGRLAQQQEALEKKYPEMPILDAISMVSEARDQMAGRSPADDEECMDWSEQHALLGRM